MAKFKEKIKAIELRKKGNSIGEIAQEIGVSKSIVSKWCRDIALTKTQIGNLHEKMKIGSYKGRMNFLEKIRKIRKDETARLGEEGKREIGKISRRDLLVGGIALYWAEGTKSPNAEETSFSNSNPGMILWILRWFEEICGVSSDRFIIQIRINKIHRNRIKEVESYWSKLIGIPFNQFTKTVLIKAQAKKVYSNNNHYGTVRVRVRSGTQLRRKIIGWIEGLATL
ncbi:MAG: hypothetical protein A3C50_01490 [Candidatus Staskawiczbacteria bacterium RIFCSPHIGHO2_02_FULL_43_16]|uniref:HTH psq-type domain-containing protein n=1 Tax=Candidatus Staskawiczbacteria bacterium RIFCSPHIGHO2_01_FULL_41_41 TaxID=1802203 RepID=A0A1G2HUC5_9BACT|nr:MAG: hypothetical protein A2822_03905 [Candidatus Staskawiczbacteria bacterium RIFCSPHIGHO2_01_FULL_41_41]OGZ69055.1 MAG: hypothetical protein A3C50_01490 [Candidatus Staskawiczbacteria bacterium RIFCSPHIGHO2_02_FULL_43_16]OGZ74518.1 MAG: hypothetical protein A3A12_02000 [Candidatus Staskawiczbacteria bacterium RIFCSPLOWO2_01_FULL_43_17b]